MQPVIKNYHGGKHGNGTYQTIINEIPPIDLYIEPMLGSGGVFCNLKLPCLTVINDIVPSIVNQYKHLTTAALIVTCGHYAGCIDKYINNSQGSLIYFDPPYLMETRRSNANIYIAEWNYASHIDFISYARSIPAKVIISHYPCSLYDEAFHDWRKVLYKSMTRAGLATECLYINYPKPTMLQDYRYIGENYTDRQRIKRRIAREISKLNALPPLERNAIINAINNSE